MIGEVLTYDASLACSLVISHSCWPPWCIMVAVPVPQKEMVPIFVSSQVPESIAHSKEK